MWSVRIVYVPNNCIVWLVNLCLLHEFVFLIGILLAPFGVFNRNICYLNLLSPNVTYGLSTKKIKKEFAFCWDIGVHDVFRLKLEWIIPVKYLFFLPFSFFLFPLPLKDKCVSEQGSTSKLYPHRLSLQRVEWVLLWQCEVQNLQIIGYYFVIAECWQKFKLHLLNLVHLLFWSLRVFVTI